MADLALAFQKAVYARLTAAPYHLTVYDNVPDDATFPYVVIGEDTIIDWSFVGVRGEELTLLLHVWSRSAGRAECKQMLEQIKTALHEQELALETGHNTLTRFAFEETLLDEDGRTWHGVIRFRALATV